MYGLYGALLRLAWACVLPYQIVIPLLTGRGATPLRERLGDPAPPAGARPGGFWVHAVSVGEVRLALPLVARLKEGLPRPSVHLTTSTATGRAIAEASRAGQSPGRPDSISALPFDLPRPMGRLLDRLAPGAILILETEIWPNLLRQSARRGIPVILVNGRISPRAYPRYRAARAFLRRVLQNVSLFGMQSEEDAARIRRLGAPAERVRITGSLKFDIPVPCITTSEARRRIGLQENAVVLVAGSTAPGEEAPILEAFTAVRRHAPQARLIVAPRHPEDFARAESALLGAGHRVALWSCLPAGDVERGGTPPYDALLIDRIGVLPEIYAAADVAFVGGSLVPRGGHNIVEPAAFGMPVLFGPHMENFEAAARALTEAGAGFVANNGAELASLAVRLLTDRTAHAVAATMARRVVEANRGAMNATLALVGEATALKVGVRHAAAAGA